jgi:diguanylate cyclase (GGDEF)-like protein
MRLTTRRHSHSDRTAAYLRPVHMLAGIGLTAAMTLVFTLDRVIGLPHVQHLYYIPIIVAAVWFGMTSGVLTATLAILLYHVANPHAFTLRYEESDILQMAVFIAVGLVAAKLADNARRLHRLAMTDDLTGLHNLRSFELELKQMVQSARTQQTPLCLLVVDVDRLKSLNDEHGHLAGAEAVRTIGSIIERHIPGDAVACRYGGDEFVIALPHCSASMARGVADDLCRAVQASVPVLAGLRFPERTLAISIGLACRSFDGSWNPTSVASDDDESEALFQAADAALYAAKNDGRNRVHTAAGA